MNVPVLVHAFPDQINTLYVQNRRDSFCGKLSICNNLKQFQIPFSLTSYHTEDPDSSILGEDLEWFAGVCRVVKGFKNLKAGAVGARPAAFNTVRFSEKILESYGISVETIDLSEIIGNMNRLDNNNLKVKGKLQEIKDYIDTAGIPEEALVKMAKLLVVLEEWIEATGVSLFSFQCWNSIEENYGIMPCTVMSMFSEKLIPAACEVDLVGGLSMYALQLASQKPSALVDWNNNFGDDPDKAILFHCSNFPNRFCREPEWDMATSSPLRFPKKKLTGLVTELYLMEANSGCLATNDEEGNLISYIAEGEITPIRLTLLEE